jgi:adenine-specific DNA-methyltransferase
VRVPQRYPGKRHYKGPRKGEFSGHPDGKNPSDLWEIPNVNANHKEKTDHPCQFPVGLAERLVKSLSPRNSIVLDPFAGVCTTGAAAALHGRRFVGCEIVPEYRNTGVQRIRSALNGSLPYRSADTPVLDPKSTGAVGRRPDHFKVT